MVAWEEGRSHGQLFSSYVGVLHISDIPAVLCSHCWLGNSCEPVSGRQVNCSMAETM